MKAIRQQTLNGRLMFINLALNFGILSVATGKLFEEEAHQIPPKGGEFHVRFLDSDTIQ